MRAILLAGGISLLISLIGTRYAIRQFTKTLTEQFFGLVD